MQAFEFDPVYGVSSGGFGGGGPSGFAWAVSNVPDFTGLDVNSYAANETPADAPPSMLPVPPPPAQGSAPVVATQTSPLSVAGGLLQTPPPPAPVNWILPAAIVVVVILLSR
jgi:hypothetical protein